MNIRLISLRKMKHKKKNNVQITKLYNTVAFYNNAFKILLSKWGGGGLQPIFCEPHIKYNFKEIIIKIYWELLSF